MMAKVSRLVIGFSPEILRRSRVMDLSSPLSQGLLMRRGFTVTDCDESELSDQETTWSR
jgi:hypothetical protein